MAFEEIKRALGLEIHQALQARPDKDPRRDPEAGEKLWIAAAGPMVDYLYLTSGSSVQDLHWVTTIGNSTTNDITAANLKSDSNIYINYDGGDADSFLYFYDNASATGAYLEWDDAPGEFVFSHPLSMSTNQIHGVVDPTDDQDAATKKYVDDTATGGGTLQSVTDAGNTTDNTLLVSASGSSFSTITVFNDVTVGGTLDVRSNSIINVVDPTTNQDAATKNYVDTVSGSIGEDLNHQVLELYGYVDTVSGSIGQDLNHQVLELYGYVDDNIGGTQNLQDVCDLGAVTTTDITAANLKANSNMYINNDGGDGDSFLYFYEGGSPTGAYLKWDDAVSFLTSSHNFKSNSNLFARYNLYLNNDGAVADSYVYFYEGGSATGKHLRWNDGNNRFEFSGTMSIFGNVSSDGDLYLRNSGPEGDSSLYFYENGNQAGAYLRWDDSEDHFAISHTTYTLGNVEAAVHVLSHNDVFINYQGSDRDGFLYFYENGSNSGAWLKWDDAISYLRTSHNFKSGANLFATNNLYLNNDGAVADSYIYFYEGGSQTGKHLRWNDGNNRFEVNSGFGALGGSLAADIDIYLRNSGPDDGDSSIYFYENGSQTGAYLRWDDSEGEFVMNQSLNLGTDKLQFSDADAYWRYSGGVMLTGKGTRAIGNVIADGNMYINFVHLTADSFLYFYKDGSNTGAHLKWDDGTTSFIMNQGLYIGDGGTTDYTEIKADGAIILHGDARVHKEIRASISDLAFGANAPSQELIPAAGAGALPMAVLSFNPSSGQDEEAYATIHMPTDIDDTVNVQFHIMWAPDASWSSGNYIWKFEYIIKGEGSLLGTGATTTITATVTPDSANTIIETTFSTMINVNTEQIVFGRIYLDNASTATVDGNLIYLELHYTADKLGHSG